MSKLTKNFEKWKDALSDHKVRRVCFMTLITFACMILLANSHFGYTLENLFARRLEFGVRGALHLDPKLDPRIKIFAFDTATMNELGTSDLTIDEWATTLSGVAARHPKLILVDKVFVTFSPLDKAQEFKRKLSSIQTPIVAGSYPENRNNLPKNAVSMESSDFDLTSMAKTEMNAQDALPHLPWLPIEQQFIVGPHESIRSGFAHLGHLLMQPFGTIKPFLRVAERKAVPHWSFYAAESLRLTSDGIDLNYHHVGLDSSGQIIPNLVAQQDARAVTWQLLSIVSLSQAKKPVESVNSGDIVIILPAMYPGNKDFVDTPRGREAGGYIIASMVNSVVSGNWLRPIGGGTIFLALTCAIGAWLAMTGTPMVVALLLFSGTFLLISAGSLGFSYMGIVSPWLFPTLGFAASGILTFYERARSNELKLNSLKTMLQGRLSEDRIKDVVKNPAILETPPSGRIVSTMFIDIVGFSMLAERQTPEEAFMNLKSLFELLRGIVMKHQGVVDKTLGDGMLCYFGYGPDGRETAREHADLALSCAVEIQKAVLAKNQEAQSQNKPIYPLRIGINTSAVFVGNIGNADHFDFTLIGSGVNLAKRYESACKHYCVMIGSTTYDTLIHRGLPGKPLIKKLIPIKHASNPLEAYECDPFMHQDREIREVTDAYRKFLGIDRKDARWPIPEDLKICVTSRFGAGRLHDFSDAGFGVIMSEYVGNGILFDFAISSQETGDPHPILSSVNFTGEIRWGRPFKKGYLHGVLIKNLSANQRKQLVDELRAILRNDATNKEHTPPEKTSVS